MNGDIIKGTVTVSKIRYFKKDTNFGILVIIPNKIEEGKMRTDKCGYVILKGQMLEPQLNSSYYITATESNDPKWGVQYNVIAMSPNISLENPDKNTKKRFLESIFTKNQVDSLYDVMEDPYEAFINEDVQSIIQTKGVGIKTYQFLLNKFKEHLDISKIMIQLEQYQLSINVMKKLLRKYGTPELVIEIVKNNPYSLVSIEGFGWKRCDQIARNGGIGEYDPRRIKAFILHYLEEKANSGYSYVPIDIEVERRDINRKNPLNLMDALVENIGEGVQETLILQSLKSIKNRLWISEDGLYIGLRKYYELECKIVEELFRIKSGKNDFNYKNWGKIIEEKEEIQGWKYTEQQKNGIQLALENQICVIGGYAGSGKTSLVDGIVTVLNEYNFVQCALSGRAASRMAEVTKKEGYTIHRLLGFPRGGQEYQFFEYNQDNKLNYDIIIIDEISMIDGKLFYYLLRAVKDGGKVILLGDVGQLESIGCLNVANDLLESSYIPSIVLTSIHRQALESEIIVESSKVRNREQIIDKDWVGSEYRGNMKEFYIECYSDTTQTFYKTLERFALRFEEVKNIKDIQVICPIKATQSGTIMLNSAIQEIYNPHPDDCLIPHYVVHKEKNYELREGDKVINVKNNYGTFKYSEKESELEIMPVFNGMIGIIKKIDEFKEKIIVSFFEYGDIVIDFKDAAQLELGYATTVHKYQGSQCKYIIFALDYSSYILLSKELVYTAFTRASDYIDVVAQNKALRMAISTNSIKDKMTHMQRVIKNKSRELEKEVTKKEIFDNGKLVF